MWNGDFGKKRWGKPGWAGVVGWCMDVVLKNHRVFFWDQKFDIFFYN